MHDETRVKCKFNVELDLSPSTARMITNEWIKLFFFKKQIETLCCSSGEPEGIDLVEVTSMESYKRDFRKEVMKASSITIEIQQNGNKE